MRVVSILLVMLLAMMTAGPSAMTSAALAGDDSAACRAGDEQACLNLVNQQLEAAQNGKDYERGYANMKALCDGGNGIACREYHMNVLRAVFDLDGNLVPRAPSVAALATLCAQHDAIACGAMGLYWSYQEPGEKDAETANAFFEHGCNNDLPFACAHGIFQQMTGRGTDKDMDGALVRLAALCSEESAGPTCNEMGYAIERSQWQHYVMRDGPMRLSEEEKRLSILFYEATCKAGSFNGCRNAAMSYIDGTVGLPVEKERGFALLRSVCVGENASECAKVGQHFGEGNGVRKDDAASHQIHLIACEGGASLGCASAAWNEGKGVGTAINKAAGLARMQQACADGSGFACNMVGLWYQGEDGYPKRPDAEALAVFTQSCALDFAQGCYLQGWMTRAGDGVKKDGEAGQALMLKACQPDNSYAPACYEAAWPMVNGESKKLQNWGAGVKLLRIGCEGDDSPSCAVLGDKLAEGGLGWDDGEAARYLRRSCNMGNEYGCNKLEYYLTAYGEPEAGSGGFKNASLCAPAFASADKDVDAVTALLAEWQRVSSRDVEIGASPGLIAVAKMPYTDRLAPMCKSLRSSWKTLRDNGCDARLTAEVRGVLDILENADEATLGCAS
jgi:TPR repeat protein